MKLKHTLFALAAMTGISQAAVYVNFNGSQTGGGPATGSPFGVSSALWVNTGNTATNATGINAGGATVTWASKNTWGDGSPASAGDESVYGGYLDDGVKTGGGGATFTVSGLTALFGSGPYTITVYSFSDDTTNPMGTLTLNGGASTAITGSPSTGTLTGTYGITTFTGVTGDSFTILGAVSSGTAPQNRSTISGFSVIPEPSSAALLGLGGLALVLRRRK